MKFLPFLRLAVPIALFLSAVPDVAGIPPTAIKLDSVSSKYALRNFSFEVSRETGNAGIRLEYSYPPARLGGDDSDRGPTPRIVMLPGLAYDRSAHAIVYDEGTNRITCATEVDRTVLFRKTGHMRSTGACNVSARVTGHAESNGWSTDRFKTLEAWFEVRRK